MQDRGVEGKDINLCPDPKWLDVMHREWLWQRPYITLELQHRPSATTETLREGVGQGWRGRILICVLILNGWM
jgi:hypothetical protein